MKEGLKVGFHVCVSLPTGAFLRPKSRSLQVSGLSRKFMQVGEPMPPTRQRGMQEVH